MNKALEDIAAERQRQIDKEGWSAEHDDQHSDESLSAAAAAYAWPYMMLIDGGFPQYKPAIPDDDYHYTPLSWPESWEFTWWKPTTRRRDLVKAGALILAEIERLDRLKGD